MLFITLFLLLSVQTSGNSLDPQVSAMITSLRHTCEMTVNVTARQYEYIKITYNLVPKEKLSTELLTKSCEKRVCEINCLWYFSYNVHVQISGPGFPVYRGNWTFKANKRIYKLDKLRQFTISANSIGSLSLFYDITNGYDKIQAINCLYRIFYKSEWDQTTKKVTTKKNYYRLRNLVPYTIYTIDLQVKHDKSIYWSDKVTHNERTLPSAPNAGPNSTNGSYLEIPCEKSKRCFILYWAMIPMPLRNGIFDSFVIKKDGKILFETSEIYAEMRNQSPNKDLWFEIQFKNKNSQSSPPTIIHIPPKALERPKGVSIVQLNNTHVKISWTLEQSSVNVTVMSCLGEIVASALQCKSNMTWTTISNGNFTILESAGAKKFAVYVSNSEGSSSLTHAECTLGRGIPRTPQIPRIVKRYPHKVSLMWPVFRCRDLNGKPTLFQTLYAEGNSCRNGSEINVPAIGTKPETENIEIKDLKPFTDYSVCLRIRTEQGWSPLSPQVNISTTETNPSSSVRNLTIADIGSSSMTLRWNPTLQPNGIITNHLVYYEKLEIYTNASNMATVSNLYPSSEYKFAVSTCNNAGCSVRSHYVTATTLIGSKNNWMIITISLFVCVIFLIGCCFCSRSMFKIYKKMNVDVEYPDKIQHGQSSESQTKLIDGEEKQDNTENKNSKEAMERIHYYTTIDTDLPIHSFDFNSTEKEQNNYFKEALKMVHLTNIHKSEANLASNNYDRQNNINLSELKQGQSDSNYYRNNNLASSELSLANLDSNVNIHEMKSELSQANSDDKKQEDNSIASSEMIQAGLDSNGYIYNLNSDKLNQANSDSNAYVHNMITSDLSQASSDYNEQGDNHIASSEMIQANIQDIKIAMLLAPRTP